MSDSQKTAVIFGLANKRSIAWAIAQSCTKQAGGCDHLPKRKNGTRAKDLITDLPGASGFMCDVSYDDQIARVFDELKSRYGVLQASYTAWRCSRGRTEGEFVNTTREAFASLMT